MSNIYRDRTLDMMNEENVGETVRVAGWVENIRDHGGVSFIDLRDMYGVLQVVIRDAELLKGIKKEECISIEGIMEKRDEETYNPKIPSGTIELEAKKITMLGQVYQTLPFEVMPVAMQKIISIFPMTQGIQLMKVTFLGLPTENVLLSVVVMGAVILICFGISVKCFKWE